jgi:hypothetical protein
MKPDKQAILETMRRPDGRYAIRDVIAVTEFRGKAGEDFPAEIPFSDGVDITALTEGDDKPFYATLKIGMADVVSGNLMYYGEEEVGEILRQTVTKRPTGGRGHLREDELSSALPANPLHWVGAVRDGDFAWGKGYIAPGETREWLRRLGATKAEVATSIFGYADDVTWDEEHDAFRMMLHAPDETGHTGFVLEYIDLASPERAGVPSLAMVPQIAREMAGNGHTRKESVMDKLELIKAMTADDAKLLPDVVVQAVITQSETAQQLAEAQRQLAELRTALGLDDKGDVIATVKAQVEETAKATQTAVTAKITELVNTVKVEDVRPVVLELVQAEKPATVEAVQAVFDSVVARESIKALLAKTVAHTMGPRQDRPTAKGGKERQFFTIPSKETAATS